MRNVKCCVKVGLEYLTRLWSPVMMQYIRTKQAEENWSMHQYNFVAGSLKTVPLVCRLEDSIKIPTQLSRTFLPMVKATVRIFSSATDLPQSLSFHTACWVPKIVFSATSSVVNGTDMLQIPSLATLFSLLCEWLFRSQLKQLLEKHSHQVLQPLILYVRIHPHRILAVYWP